MRYRAMRTRAYYHQYREHRQQRLRPGCDWPVTFATPLSLISRPVTRSGWPGRGIGKSADNLGLVRGPGQSSPAVRRGLWLT